MKIEEYPWSEEMANGERNSGSNDKKKTILSSKTVTKTLLPCTEKLHLLLNSRAIVKSDKISV